MDAATNKAGAERGPLPKKVVVDLTIKTPKKNSVRYQTKKPDAPLESVYVSNAAVAELGDPKFVRVTIEAVR